MNLKEEMEKHQWFENAGEPTGDIPIIMAVILAKKYAEEMCRKQREICSETKFFRYDYSATCFCEANGDAILNAPLATEEIK